MRKLIIGAVAVISLSFATTILFNQPIKAATTELTCKHGQCAAKAKSTGNRCKHCVSKAGDTYCYQHK